MKIVDGTLLAEEDDLESFYHIYREAEPNSGESDTSDIVQIVRYPSRTILYGFKVISCSKNPQESNYIWAGYTIMCKGYKELIVKKLSQ